MKKRIAVGVIVLAFLLAGYFLIQFAVTGTRTVTFQSAKVTSTPLPGAVISALVRLGDTDDAYKQLVGGLTAGTASIESSAPWMNFWIGWTITKNIFAGFVLPILSILIVLIFIEEFIRRRVFNFGKRIQMTINNFEFGSASFKNDGLPKSIANEVKDDLYKFYSANKVSQYGATDLQEPSNPFRLLNQSVESIEIPPMVPSQISVLLGFVMKLFPPRTLIISGQLEYDYENGVGLSITFDDNIIEHIACSKTLWEKELKIPILKLKHVESTPAGNAAAPAAKPSTKYLKIAPSAEQSTAQAEDAAAPEQKTAGIETVCEADQYYSRCCVLADIASTWIYYKILKSDNICKVKEYFGTDDFDSIQWFILFLIHYEEYRHSLQTHADISLKEAAENNLLRSLRCDQHNAVANFNLGWLLNHPTTKPPAHLKQNDFTLFLTRAIQTSEPSDSININANYCLGDYYLNHYLEELKEQKKSIDFLSEEARQLCFQKYFNSVSQGVAKSHGMKENAKLAFQIPCLVEFCVFSSESDSRKLQQIKRIENRKNTIEIQNTKENNVDFYYNLACFYSLVANSKRLPPNIVAELKKPYYPEDEQKIIGYPSDLYQFSLRNLEIACECDFQKVLNICKNDMWLDNIRANNWIEYDAIIQKYTAFNKAIHPKKKAKGKKK